MDMPQSESFRSSYVTSPSRAEFEAFTQSTELQEVTLMLEQAYLVRQLTSPSFRKTGSNIMPPSST
jgi:hypothetical protein